MKIRYALLLLAICAPGWAQEVNGIISGTVFDQTGAVVPGASVIVENAATGVVAWRGRSSDTGSYVCPALPVGEYNVTVNATGFKRQRIEKVPLRLSQRARVDATLQPGDVVETVTVAGEAFGQLETESSSLSTTVNTAQVANLPMPNRNVLSLLMLVPGVSGGGTASDVSASTLTINGSRVSNQEFMIDGVSVVSNSTGNLVRMPTTESIREFKVLTSAYSAEYGRTAGPTVALTVQSGTQEYHGALYEYFRNEKLNGNGFFRNLRNESRPVDRWNQFGGRIGGPVSIPKIYDGRNRTFFFFNYEAIRRVSPFSNSATIPDALLRAGDFSATPVQVNDPDTKAPFPGKRIPVNRIDPAAAKYMGLLPAPNSPGTPDTVNGRTQNNFRNIGSNKPTNNDYTARVDEALGDKVRLYGRYTYYYGESQGSPLIPGPLDNATGDSITKGHQLAIGYTHTWTPTLITDVNLGFMREDPDLQPPNPGLNVRDVLGIQRSVGGTTPRVMMSSWANMGVNENTLRQQINNNYQASFSLTKVHGPFTTKVGGGIRKNQFNVYNPGQEYAGLYSFNGEVTHPSLAANNPINALADFLLGAIQTSSYSLSQPMSGRRSSDYSVYVQEDWKVNRRLTMNLGLRWEYETPLVIANNMYSRVSPITGKLLVANSNASRSLDLNADKINFAPRVGFAYSVNPKTVIRSAFGMFYGQFFSNMGGIVLYPGFSRIRRYTDPGPGVAQPFRFFEGNPLTAVQNFADPFFVERESTPGSPLAPTAQFTSLEPLPYLMQWNFGVQREIVQGMTVEANYVGSRGKSLPFSVPQNQAPFALGTEAARLGTDAQIQLLRPFPNVTRFNSAAHINSSWYDALQLRVVRQFSRGIALTSHYTFAKSLDDGEARFSSSTPNGLDGGQFPAESRNLEKSLSQFDRRHNFVAAVQYVTPGSRWTRGIEINPVLTIRDGLRDTIAQTNLHPSAVQQRPSIHGSTNGGAYANSMTNEGQAVRYLLSPSDASFPFVPTGPLFSGSGATRTLVLPFIIGNLGRNTTREPGEVNLDISVARRFPIRDRMNFQLRFEAFNAFNHTNFNAANAMLNVTVSGGQAVFNAPDFGRITSAKSARRVQLVARFEF